jgi:hypothetical protein
MVGPAMILFVLTGRAPAFLVLLLALLVYLSWLDLRDEPVDGKVKLWWYLLVVLLNIPAYLALRIWLAVVRRRRREAGG